MTGFLLRRDNPAALDRWMAVYKMSREVAREHLKSRAYRASLVKGPVFTRRRFMSARSQRPGRFILHAVECYEPRHRAQWEPNCQSCKLMRQSADHAHDYGRVGLD